MKIYNNNQYREQSFTGYVSPNVKNLVAEAVSKTCKGYLQEANSKKVSLNTGDIINCKNLGNQIISNLDKAMEKFHKDTNLDLNWYDRFILKNTKTGTELKFSDAHLEKEVGKVDKKIFVIYSNEPDKNLPLENGKKGLVFLNSMLEFSCILNEKVSQKNVDRCLFRRFLKDIRSDALTGGFLARIRVLNKAEQVQSMAEEFGVKSDGIAYGLKRRVALNKIYSKKSKEIDKQHKRFLSGRKIKEEKLISDNIKSFNELMESNS